MSLTVKTIPTVPVRDPISGEVLRIEPENPADLPKVRCFDCGETTADWIYVQRQTSGGGAYMGGAEFTFPGDFSIVPAHRDRSACRRPL